MEQNELTALTARVRSGDAAAAAEFVRLFEPQIRRAIRIHGTGQRLQARAGFGRPLPIGPPPLPGTAGQHGDTDGRSRQTARLDADMARNRRRRRCGGSGPTNAAAVGCARSASKSSPSRPTWLLQSAWIWNSTNCWRGSSPVWTSRNGGSPSCVPTAYRGRTLPGVRPEGRGVAQELPPRSQKAAAALDGRQPAETGDP